MQPHSSVVPRLLLGFACAYSLAYAADDTALMTITERSGSPQSSRTFSISRVFRQGDIPQTCALPVVDSEPVSAWQCDKRASWPDGSLKHAVVSFTTSLDANQKISLSFRATDSICHLGDSDSCHQAALTGEQALAFDKPAWGAALELTGQGGTFTASAQEMLAAGDFRYWLRGPVVTQMIIEDRTVSRRWDIGWPPAPKGLHPMFIVSFNPASAAVKIEAVLENMWTTDLADQSYSLNIAGKDGGSVFQQAMFNHNANSRWRQSFWQGEAPRPVRYDWNLPYLISTNAIPNYDTSIPVTKAHVDSLVSRFAASDRGRNFGANALWLRGFPTGGGRPDIGWLPSWYVQYLFNSDERLEPMMDGMATVAGHPPLHYREGISDPKMKWCPSSCTGDRQDLPAFGRPVSVETRPQVYLQRNYWQWNGIPASDHIKPVGPTSAGGWTVDIAHHPSIAYLPYLLTGDYYLYEEILFWLSHAMGSAFWRGGSWGLMTPTTQMEPRGQAWAIRTLSQAAFVALDGSPEKEYLSTHIGWQAEYMEGYYGILNGRFPPVDASCPGYTPTAEPSDVKLRNRWCHGRLSVGFRQNPIPLPGYPGAGVDPNCRPTHFAAYNCELIETRFPVWMAAYLNVSLGMALDQGFDAFSNVHQHLATFWIDGILHPDSLPHLIAGGGFYASWLPSTSISDKQFFGTWSDFRKPLFSGQKTTTTSQLDTNGTTFRVADPSVIGFGKLVWTRTVARGEIQRLRQDARIATATFRDPHGLAVGDPISGAGATITQYNGTFSVVAVPNLNEIQFSVATTATEEHRFPGYSLKTPTSGIPVRIGEEIVNVCGIEHDGTLMVGGSTFNTNCGPNLSGRTLSNGTSTRRTWPVGTEVQRDYSTWNTTINDAVHGYPWVARAGHSFSARYQSTTGRSGADSWAWIEDNLTSKFGGTGSAVWSSGNPAWMILPKQVQVQPAPMGAPAAKPSGRRGAKALVRQR